MDAIYPRLCLSAIFWWSDDKDEAVAELARVVDSVRPESELRLDLAELLVQERSPADAIALLDAVQPLDNLSLRRREELAIDAAIAAGNVDRARQAGQRLFGLRLDTETQIELSAKLHQLGLHELAEALLGRARRRAGNKIDSLVALMLQYQRQGKSDQAAQAAMQIIFATTPTQQSGQTASLLLESESSRTAAMNVLARSGRLPRLIERAREQLATNPSSIRLYQTLADYFVAARQNENARKSLEKLLELRPGDAGLRIQVANRLTRIGQARAALDHYRIAFKKDPSILGESSTTIMNAFVTAGRHQELMVMLSEVDLRDLWGSGDAFARFLQRIPKDPILSEAVGSLFRRGWASFPDDRPYLISSVHRDEIWRLPDIFDLARQAVIPGGPGFRPADSWYLFVPEIARFPTGTVDQRPPIGRILDLAADRNRLDELGAEVESARKSNPDWPAGDALLAVIRCRAGRYDEARVLFEKVMDGMEKRAFPLTDLFQLYAYWSFGLELERHPATRDLAALVYEKACRSSMSLVQLRYQSDILPIDRLTELYLHEGRPDAARRAWLGITRAPLPDGYTDEDIKMYRRFGLPKVADSLVELGFAADAVPLYSEALALDDEVGTDLPAFLQTTPPEDRPRRIRAGFRTAMERMTHQDLAPVAGRAIKGATGEEKGTAPAAELKRVKPSALAIDLEMIVYPRELENASVRSLVAESLSACTAGQLAVLDEPLEKLRKAHLADLSVAITMALRALASNDKKQIERAFDQLADLVEKTPLEPLAEGVRANSRQRASAALQIPLWIVARACRRHEGPPRLTTIVEKLADRALEAARRQLDNLVYLVMIRERGEGALERGDRALAQAEWRRMLKLVIEPPAGRIRRPNPGSVPAPRSRPAPGGPAGAAPQPAPSRKSTVPQPSP